MVENELLVLFDDALEHYRGLEPSIAAIVRELLQIQNAGQRHWVSLAAGIELIEDMVPKAMQALEELEQIEKKYAGNSRAADQIDKAQYQVVEISRRIMAEYWESVAHYLKHR